MASSGRRGGDEDDRGRRDRERERHHEHEPYDDPGEHRQIERRRFAGGPPPTPELYALAREQWYRLPGVVVRPSMDPVISAPMSDEAQPPDQAHPGEKEPGQ